MRSAFGRQILHERDFRANNLLLFFMQSPPKKTVVEVLTDKNLVLRLNINSQTDF